MKYRLLGNSGLRVSEVALGTMTFGEDWGWGSSIDEACKIYDTYRSAGGNFIDTANVYTNGTSESFVSDFIHDHRQSVVLATKYTCTVTTGDANAGGNHPQKHGAASGGLAAAIEDRLYRSLLAARLGSDDSN